MNLVSKFYFNLSPNFSSSEKKLSLNEGFSSKISGHLFDQITLIGLVIFVCSLK